MTPKLINFVSSARYGCKKMGAEMAFENIKDWEKYLEEQKTK